VLRPVNDEADRIMWIYKGSHEFVRKTDIGGSLRWRGSFFNNSKRIIKSYVSHLNLKRRGKKRKQEKSKEKRI